MKQAGRTDTRQAVGVDVWADVSITNLVYHVRYIFARQDQEEATAVYGM